MNRGRPRIFVTPAEKQKAYRERKRQAEMLRNSSGNILSEPDPVDSDLLALWETKCDHTATHERLRKMPFYGSEWEAFGGYDEWKSQINTAYALWEEASTAWYDEWKRQGYPEGPWTIALAQKWGR